jgi:hypothetical protein
MNGPTTIYVLHFFQQLNRVFVQDCAAMLALHPERQDHPMFREISMCSSAEFQEYLDEMAKELREQIDPLDASLEKVLPGLHQWQRINNVELGGFKPSTW